jgi:hypothetical protein
MGRGPRRFVPHRRCQLWGLADVGLLAREHRADDLLRSLPNTLLLPHIGDVTIQAWSEDTPIRTL